MLSTRWDPTTRMNRLRDEMDRLFGRYVTSQPARLGEGVFPALNLWEDEENLYVESELPGIDLGQLEIHITADHQLSIKGQRVRVDEHAGKWHRQERGFGSFTRVVELPYSVDNERVSAQFNHGVLTITLPKSEEVKPRRIEVTAS